MNAAVFLPALASCVVLLVSAPLHAQTTMDSGTALELAGKSDSDWRAAGQEIEIARGKLTTARLINPFNPVLEGQGGPFQRSLAQGHTLTIAQVCPWRSRSCGAERS